MLTYTTHHACVNTIITTCETKPYIHAKREQKHSEMAIDNVDASGLRQGTYVHLHIYIWYEILHTCRNTVETSRDDRRQHRRQRAGAKYVYTHTSQVCIYTSSRDDRRQLNVNRPTQCTYIHVHMFAPYQTMHTRTNTAETYRDGRRQHRRQRAGAKYVYTHTYLQIIENHKYTHKKIRHIQRWPYTT